MARRVWVRPEFGDGCSFSPDTAIVTVPGPRPREVRAVSLVPCCQDHDLATAIGGDSAARLEADRAFRACLRCRVGWFRSAVYYRAVRLFGGVFWRWTA